MRATLLLAALWALWHAPLFFALASYHDFSPFTIPAFLIGITAGALVLTSIYNGTGGSILAVAVWHAAYNLSAATAAADGTIAAIATACVIFWAITLVHRERGGEPALGRPEAAP
jgi:CAAX protease family protein